MLEDVNENENMLEDVNENENMLEDVNENMLEDVNENENMLEDVNENENMLEDVNENENMLEDVNENENMLEDAYDIENLDEYFKDLYRQYKEEMKGNLSNQLKAIRQDKYKKFRYEKYIITDTNIHNTSDLYKNITNTSAFSGFSISLSNSNTDRLSNIEITGDNYSINIMSEIVEPRCGENSMTDIVKPWPDRTVCILGDSMLSDLGERRLGRNNNVTVRFHRGGNLEDMFDHVKAV